MSKAVNVLSLQALKELEEALGRFATGCLDSLGAVESQTRRGLEILEERLRQRKREVAHWQQAYDTADGEQDDIRYISYKLEEAQEELRKIRFWQNRVEEQFQSYRRHAGRLRDVATERTIKARAFLRQKLAELQDYIAAQANDSGNIIRAGAREVSNDSAAWPAYDSMLVVSDFERSNVITNGEVQQLLQEKIPPAHRQPKDLLSIGYTDVYEPYSGGYVAGETIVDKQTQRNIIKINKQSRGGSSDKNEMERTLIHEIGHNVHLKVLGEEKWERWESISEASGDDGYVSEYARTNPYEDFAESYEIYIHDPEYLQKTNPHKYTFIRDEVFEGKEY